MGKYPNKALTAAKIRGLKPGFHADGNCLYLAVEDSGSAHWIVRTTIGGKRCDVGLGGLKYVSLADARERAIDIRKAARAGGDPVAERRELKKANERENRIPTFEAAARAVHREREKGFRNERHKAQWIGQLEKFAFPALGAMRIDEITPADALKVLTPMWMRIPDIARRVKQRMKVVFDWARASGHRIGDNPVEGIERALPKHNRKQEHFAALPFNEVPVFIQALRSDAGISGRLAFEFLILTASRTNEVIKARWSEIDFTTNTWTRPAANMKAGIEHRVPLAARCVEILEEVKKITDGGPYIFPGMRAGSGLSNMAFHMTLRRMGKTGLTPHGFRSSFRDWAEEKTDHKRHTIETALAHVVKDKVEAAYLRTELFEQRKDLMQVWARFATGTQAAPAVK